MSEGDFSPRSFRLKPLTRAQLQEMKERFKNASKRIDEIKDLEGNHKDDIEHPEWL